MEILGVNIATLVKIIYKSHHKQCYEDTGSLLMKILCVFSPLPSQLLKLDANSSVTSFNSIWLTVSIIVRPGAHLFQAILLKNQSFYQIFIYQLQAYWLSNGRQKFSPNSLALLNVNSKKKSLHSLQVFKITDQDHIKTLKLKKALLEFYRQKLVELSRWIGSKSFQILDCQMNFFY